ncbi:MAG: radical SAM protein [Candidatus Omnitrophica bacterium]|nr:radical SAM protein [Candidatus Omnitrophota bacterium]
MKVALILAPDWSRTKPPLSLALLSAALRERKHTVHCLDLNNQLYHRCQEEYKDKWEQKNDFYWKDICFVNRFIKDHRRILDDYIDYIFDNGIYLIGFSLYFPNQLMSLEIARLIKERDKNRITVFGGPQALPYIGGLEILRNESVDAIVVYEGERTIVELSEIVEAKGTLDVCPGVIFKKCGEIIDSGEREAIGNLDLLPFADFSDFFPYPYEHSDELPILSSRGCINSCLFCTGRLPWQRYRSQSGSRTFEEIRHQVERYPQIKFFSFHDCTVNGNLQELEHFFDLMIEEKRQGRMKDVRWWCQGVIRPAMNAAFLWKMREAGCWQINYGIESGSQKVVSRMGKNFGIETADEVVRNTHQAGISVSATFMFGFPGEEEGDFKQTIEFLERNKDSIDELIPSDGFCTIERPSPLYKHAQEYGLYSNPHPFYWETRDGKNTYPERFRRFDAFIRKSREAGIKLSGSYEKNLENRAAILKEYTDYTCAVPLNICADLIEKSEDNTIQFFWQIDKECNFNCLYCKTRDKESQPSSHSCGGQNDLKFTWRRIYERYGLSEITIMGGEPALYPHFFEIAEHISKYHTLIIHTNLSLGFTDFCTLNERRVSFKIGVHPNQHNEMDILDKAVILQKKGFAAILYCLAYPPHLNFITALNKQCLERGLTLRISAFWGRYQEKLYPQDYTDDEIEMLKPYLGDRYHICYNLNGESPKGKLCNAGYKRVFINPRGEVFRCRYDMDQKMGDITQDVRFMLDKPLVCSKEFCPYNEFDTVVEPHEKDNPIC